MNEFCEFLAFHLDPDEYNFMTTTQIQEKYRNRAHNFIQSYERLKKLAAANSFDRSMAFDAAKPFYGEDKTALKDWFMDNNLLLFNKKEGAQLSKFIELIGINGYQEKIGYRLSNPISLFVWV